MIPVDLSTKLRGWIYDLNGSRIGIHGIGSQIHFSGSKHMSAKQSLLRRAPTVRSRNSGWQENLVERLTMPMFNVPFKAGHGLSHSWLWLAAAAPTNLRPSPSGVSNIERRSDSNPGSHYRESTALPTELPDRRFAQKRCLSIFSYWLIVERSQKWPSPRSSI